MCFIKAISFAKKISTMSKVNNYQFSILYIRYSFYFLEELNYKHKAGLTRFHNLVYPKLRKPNPAINNITGAKKSSFRITERAYYVFQIN